MTGTNDHSAGRAVWELVRGQYGVVSRSQLEALGVGRHGIAHRLERGRLHRVWPAVFAVGRPELTQRGRWMAAVLAGGPGAALSHRSAAALWGIGGEQRGRVEISTPTAHRCRQAGITSHRRALPDSDLTTRAGIPVTCVVRTLIDIACSLDLGALERAVNEADRLDLIDPEALRMGLDAYRGQRGVARLRELLDRRTFRLTDSELERWFLPQVRKAGLPLPSTRQRLNGFKVDFLWPDHRLVVETDGLRYHRTPAQQARDRVRDQAHLAAGFIPLRFTHWQVRYERQYVRMTLLAVIRRIEARRSA